MLNRSKFAFFGLAAFTALQSNYTIFAQNDVAEKIPYQIINNVITNEADVKSYSITDKNTIMQIADKENLKNPEEIKEITFTYYDVNDVNTEDQKLNNNLTIDGHYIVWHVKNQGTGYKYVDQFSSSIYQGPAHISKTYEKSTTSTAKCDVKINTNLISEALGFTIGETVKCTDAFSTDVPNGKSLELRVYANLCKYTYDIGLNIEGLIHDNGSGEAYKPVRLLFEQITR